jgi:class 3 adenylate cyclase
LGDVSQHVHCDVCNIDYQVNFEQSVELVFKPNSSIRALDESAYCIGGPQITPHIVTQMLVTPNRSYTFTAPAELGRYRVRTALLPGGQYVHINISGADATTIRVDQSGWGKGETFIRPGAAMTFENATQTEQLLMFERMAWSDQAATAADVTTLQLFRDQFSGDVLRGDVQIGVGSLTVMFTDLRASTALYREIGDAPAFGVVMNHFDILKKCIDAEHGAVVKTNGDAAMAVFRRPINAIRAAVAAQTALALPAASGRPLALKIGLHTGSCIAVNLNERLDYFGSVINIAARLESLSNGDDIVISQEMYLDPEVIDYFSRSPAIGIAPFASTLKGFDDQQFELWRLMTAAPDIRTLD